MRSVKLQTNFCVSSSCHSVSEVICRHCSQNYCQLCFLCHRKNILDDMQSISDQMKTNRHQGIAEVAAFIDKQSKDAHDQAKKLVDDAIDRIVKASKNIYAYIENRRLAKLGRLDECLEKFDKDFQILNSKLTEQTFLPADQMLDLRQKYAYNMFDSISVPVEAATTVQQAENEKFFNDYRFYHELINLRQKWTFFQAALTTVYFPAKKDISLDKILTFLEYRHDRVLENYREHLSTNEDSKDLALKPTEDLLNQLSFLSRKLLPTESENFDRIDEKTVEAEAEAEVEAEETKPQNPITIDVTPKTDSGQGDDETSSTSSQSWQIEDASDDDYDTRFQNLSQSMKILEKQFEDDFRLVQSIPRW